MKIRQCALDSLMLDSVMYIFSANFSTAATVGAENVLSYTELNLRSLTFTLVLDFLLVPGYLHVNIPPSLLYRG